jgi:hypothetical protein
MALARKWIDQFDLTCFDVEEPSTTSPGRVMTVPAG